MSEYLGDPERIWVLLVPLALGLLFWWSERRKRRLLEELVGESIIAEVVVGLDRRRRFWKLALRALAALLIALAILRPQWGESDVVIRRQGIDLVFAVDVSKSMLAEDVQPNRLERVRQDLRYFVDNVVRDDRISLVAFAGDARTLCPLTLDRAAFDIFLDELAIGAIPLGGTDLAGALSSCLSAFGDERRNHKAIVLFSDGEAHDGIPEAELAECKQRGVRVYTIGIGDEKGQRIPVLDENGERSFLKQEDGDYVLTRLDDRILKTVAQRSLDGAYTHLASGRANLAEIYYDNIKKIEQRELESKKRVRRIDRFPWFVGAALILLCLQALIREGVPSAPTRASRELRS